jgi:hypothetical protein
MVPETFKIMLGGGVDDTCDGHYGYLSRSRKKTGLKIGMIRNQEHWI